jgi:small subunit ribosomal protein S17
MKTVTTKKTETAKKSRVLTGIVASTKMNHTAIVTVTETRRHPLYKKPMKHTEHYAAHVEGVEVAEGQTVRMREIRPMSKTKHFKITEVVK